MPLHHRSAEASYYIQNGPIKKSVSIHHCTYTRGATTLLTRTSKKRWTKSTVGHGHHVWTDVTKQYCWRARRQEGSFVSLDKTGYRELPWNRALRSTACTNISSYACTALRRGFAVTPEQHCDVLEFRITGNVCAVGQACRGPALIIMTPEMIQRPRVPGRLDAL